MPTDQSIEKAQMKQLIEKLKQSQTIERLSSDEKAPETASAAQELIQRLKAPREPEMDLRPLAALASPSVGQRLLQATQAPTAFSQDEQRLAKAAQMESTLAKLKGAGADDVLKRQERMYFKDRSTFEKAYDQAGGFGRGSKVQRDLKEQTNLLSDAQEMIMDIVNSGEPLTPQVARDFSQLMSRSISGGSPAIQLVEATIMKSLGGKAKEAFQYLTGKPTENYLGEEAFDALKQQFGRLYQQKLSHYGENIARQRNKIKSISPEFLEQFDSEYGDMYDLDERGHAAFKRRGGYGSTFSDKAELNKSGNPTQYSAEEIEQELIRRGLK